MQDIDLIGITARRAQILTLVANHKTQSEIARELHLSQNGVRSHIAWLRARTGKRSMRRLGEWWQGARKDWLVEMAGVAGLAVEPAEASQLGKGHIKIGPMGGLIV